MLVLPSITGQIIYSPSLCRAHPNIAHLLYDLLPIQCKQCGIRFANDSAGKQDMQDHLDMHFRQNCKANQNIGHGHSRSWFVTLEVCDFFLTLTITFTNKDNRIGHRTLSLMLKGIPTTKKLAIEP